MLKSEQKLFTAILLTLMLSLGACSTQPDATRAPGDAPQWEQVEITFEAKGEYANPYTELEVWVDFEGPDSQIIRRPAFWDGANVWKVRFASPVSEGVWNWKSTCSNAKDSGLHGRTGVLQAGPYTGGEGLLKHGLLRMSPGKRNVSHADGTPFILVADTPWALSWRADLDATRVYAANRQERRFNAALLMSVQPDQDARGPRARMTNEGFEIGFDDLSEGHLNKLNPAYFQYLDQIVSILVEHGIVPVYQPVFHGYGWKGLRVLGPQADPGEYSRYCRYLVARYGAKPAMWLISGDNNGLDPCVEAGGAETEKWDAYQQPAGIHYNPFDDYQPDFMRREQCFHMNRSHQDKEWLDFQWCQTGHDGKHLYHKVAGMYENLPIKAVANGEPTYEGMRDSSNGAGWWQGREAWNQLIAGGTMGVIYGAAGLWQWKINADEPGWPEWANAQVSWRQAIDLPGAVFVGYVGRALAGMDFIDMEKRPELAGGKPCLAKPGQFYLVYLEEGGPVTLSGLDASLPYRWFNPKTGEFGAEGSTQGASMTFKAPGKAPWVLLVGAQS
jgi:hypothetical protein